MCSEATFWCHERGTQIPAKPLASDPQSRWPPPPWMGGRWRVASRRGILAMAIAWLHWTTENISGSAGTQAPCTTLESTRPESRRPGFQVPSHDRLHDPCILLQFVRRDLPDSTTLPTAWLTATQSMQLGTPATWLCHSGADPGPGRKYPRSWWAGL